MSTLLELQNITDKTLILASTERVARHLKLQASLLQSLAGNRTWFAKGQIKTVTAWIESAWLDLMPDEQLLFPVQELAVVKGIADRSSLLPDNLISSMSTARRVNQAHAQVLKYQIPLDRERFAFKQEYEVFWSWQTSIAEESASNGYVFRAELPKRLLAAIEAGKVDIPERVVIIGILNMNPAEKAVFAAMEARGATVVELAEPEQKAVPKLVRVNDQADEFSRVAAWVNSLLQPHVDEPHAAPTIAIVVPDMRVYQAPLEQALTLTVSPASLMPAQGGTETREPWDISSGASLGGRPMIRAAMDILSITSRKADSEAFSRVLRSRWVGGCELESGVRATLDIWMRENAGLSMTGKDFRRALTKNSKTFCPDFTRRFDAMLDAQEAITKPLYPSEWVEFYDQALKIMGWPETRELSSANFQTLNAWAEALALFRTLDYQLGPCDYERAYSWLREVVETRQFQPRISHVAPVSILGYEEAIGLTFDNVWVLGASSSVLPLPAEPNPFLPLDLQVAAGIPEASSELSLVKAQKLVGALLGTSQEVIVSCPSHDAKGSALSASELFGSWPSLDSVTGDRGAFVNAQINKLDRSQYAEETVPPMSEEEIAVLKGGVSIFKNYAESPFFAFACNRLGATPFPTPIIGLDPRIQGTMMHAVEELFWKSVKTSVALKAMDPETLRETVKAKVAEASENLLNKLIWRYGVRLIKLEQARLVELAMDWLAFEAARVYEFEVLAVEEKHSVNVYGVPLSITLDRRERITVSETSKFINLIDYKSSASLAMSSLNADKLTEPQLPIYATQIDPEQFNEETIDGVTLAQVNSAKIGAHVRSAFGASLIEHKPRKGDVATPADWQAQKDAWDMALQVMAEGFLGGTAFVEDVNMKLPMGYEHLGPLMR
jgi:probable DNA repair protein